MTSTKNLIIMKIKMNLHSSATSKVMESQSNMRGLSLIWCGKDIQTMYILDENITPTPNGIDNDNHVTVLF